jgi:hypothetical protein
VTEHADQPVPLELTEVQNLRLHHSAIRVCLSGSDAEDVQRSASTRKAVIGQVFYWSKTSVLQFLSMTSRSGFSLPSVGNVDFSVDLIPWESPRFK